MSNITETTIPVKTGHTCPNVFPADGTIRTYRACEVRHGCDFTQWCPDCAARYIADLAADHDSMGGTHNGQEVGGFHGHEESLDRINAMLTQWADTAKIISPEESVQATQPMGGDDNFLGDEERAFIALTMSDLEWANEFLEPVAL